MKKRIGLLFITILLTLCFTGCGVDATGSTYKFHTYVDKETGVNYIWLNSDSGVDIQPRYNDDGSLYVTK